MFVGDYVFFIIASISIITVFFVCCAYMMFTYAKEVVYYRNTKFIEYFFKGVGLGLLCNLATCFVLLFVALCCSLRLEAWNYLGKFLKHETFLIILLTFFTAICVLFYILNYKFKLLVLFKLRKLKMELSDCHNTIQELHKNISKMDKMWNEEDDNQTSEFLTQFKTNKSNLEKQAEYYSTHYLKLDEIRIKLEIEMNTCEYEWRY